MTTTIAARSTITIELSDGTTGHIVGYIDAFPSHPARGTIAAPIPGPDEPLITTSDAVFALVSVRWATEITTVDVSTGTSTVDYVTGLLGPNGTSWYLALVEPTEHGFATIGGHAAGEHTAPVPAIDGITEARVVKVHDFALW